MKDILSTTDWNSLAFVLGGPEIVILLGLLAIPVTLVLVILVIIRATRRSGPPPAAPIAQASGERLRELDALRDQKLITDDEYRERRKEILQDI